MKESDMTMTDAQMTGIELAQMQVERTGKRMSKRAGAKLFDVPVAVIERDVGGGRQARQVDGANRYPKRVQQAVNGALRTLARAEALTYFTDEQLAEYFASLGVKADKLRFLGAVFEGIGELMREKEKESPQRKCAVCGDSLHDYRADAIYCERARCRQAAYRKRRRTMASVSDTTAELSRVTDMPSLRAG
jgi:hypothetical protein